ncbi:hypothetical protein C8F04DRAFT_1077530 [Mycena alexandri]|uniref:MYND-type domain-containing protein n=1 Tax=Mycena alexandri TaxID=1745969 RepID=A0AAD6TA68_9AGAR|nr:hypothetical protein C8F04DRAFT_1077530 [Mycena alexandri]
MSARISDDSDSDHASEEFEERQKGPLRCDNCRKSPADLGISKMKMCSACSSAPYCSVECQRQNWKKHKVDCKRVTNGELLRGVLSEPIRSIGGAKRKGTRTMGKALHELGSWAQVHNGEALTVAAWQALGLLGDIEARKSKVLVLGLCRSTSDTPKLYYTLKEAYVASVTELRRIFKHYRGNPGPSRMLRENERIRQADGAIGAVMVISVEQPEDDPRSVLEALSQVSPMTFQPLGVFEEHRISFSQRLGQLHEQIWKPSLANVLRGGRFLPMFLPA